MTETLLCRKLWVTMGWLIVMAIIVVSLCPNPPGNLLVNGWDKVWHASAYALLMFWFALLYGDRKTRIGMAVGFMLMGFLIEVAQGLSIIRFFDLADALANAIGVLIGGGLIRTRLANTLFWVENNLMRKKI